MKRRFTLGVLVVLGALGSVQVALAADVYEGYDRVGKVERSYGARYNVYAGYTRVAYVSRTTYSSRWNVLEG